MIPTSLYQMCLIYLQSETPIALIAPFFCIFCKKKLAPLNEVGTPAQSSYLIQKDEREKFYEKY